MRDPLHIRRDPRCAWADFWHRARVGFVVFVAIIAVQYLLR